MSMMVSSNSSFFLLSFGILSAFCLCSPSAVDVKYDGRAIKIDGERKIILSGSIHYPRSTPSMWPDLIKKSKDGGLNAIETYVFWNAHEPQRRQYDFSENLDIVRFIKTIQEEGLYAILRIGPYVCAEWNYGGLPVWLHNMPNAKLRTNNPVFKNEMQNFTTLIVDMMKHENLFASQGGPIILAQIENEYGHVIGSYGEDGQAYIKWCAQMAQSLDIGVPWLMCEEADAPEPMIDTCNGWYCDHFIPNNENSPKIWTENWTGWFKGWGLKNPRRTAEDLAFAVARFFQLGGSMQNYYMYHGGTNFGRTAGGPFITTSYDYDAPLDEYGNLNQPKWGHLKQLHHILMSMEKTLVNGVRRDVNYGNMMAASIYSYEGKSVCFLSNTNENEDKTINLFNKDYTVPAWSVSLLPDCNTEVYNTAKVNSQKSVMKRVLNKADDNEPYNLKWEWRPEHFEHLKNDSLSSTKDIVLTTNQLIDQKTLTNDTTDYLWYMTRVFLDETDPVWDDYITLHVHTSGHILHAFVNGKHVGSQWAHNGTYEFIFEKDVKMKKGLNTISLLSVTAGLKNFGADFDSIESGIHGPVKLIGSRSRAVKDLSSNSWSYKVGLNGIENGLYEVDNQHNQYWSDSGLPVNRMFVWYKTTFQAPLGTDPVVVDLMGLGKGIAWVNGHNIGRYWPGYLADEDGCSRTCNYRGSYTDRKCLTNCGKPTQRWYHIPRDFLNADNNVLVMFEEFGGHPMNVQFQTVTVGKICAHAYEGNTLDLACQGGSVISEIRFASFGDPEGICESFRKGTCESANATSVIETACLGKESCSIDVSEQNLGATGCRGATYRLAVEAVC